MSRFKWILAFVSVCGVLGIKAQEVNILSGRHSVVVRQKGSGVHSYKLKVAGRNYEFTLHNDDEYRVKDLPEKPVSVVLTRRNGALSTVTKGKLPVYGEQFESQLPTERVTQAFLDREVDELTLLHDQTPAAEGVQHVGAQITYKPLRGQEVTRLLRGRRTTVVTRNNDISVRQAWLPQGCADTLFSPSVNMTARDISLMEKWAGFQLPKKITVEADDSTLNTEAVRRYARILKGRGEADSWVPEIEHVAPDTNRLVREDYSDFYNRVILRVINVLFTPEDSVFIVNELINRIGAMTKEKDGFDGSIPAYLAHRGNNNVLMKLNIPYLENYYKRLGWDALENEQWGIFLHELCHAYQKYPQYSRRNNDDYSIAVEGMADAVRFTAKGFGDRERIQAGLQGAQSEKRWLTPYRVSACFIMWLRNFDGDFIRKFERSIGEIQGWTVERGIKHVLGPQYEVEYLWNKYIEEVKAEAGER